MIAPNASRSRLLWIVSLLALAQTVILAWLIFAFRVELHDKIAAHCQCRLVFLGDSLTADGGVWGWRLGRWWPDNRNFGRPGADLYVVRSVVDEVVPALRPECVVLMAGVNDFGRGHDAARVIRDYDEVIERVGVETTDESSAMACTSSSKTHAKALASRSSPPLPSPRETGAACTEAAATTPSCGRPAGRASFDVPFGPTGSGSGRLALCATRVRTSSPSPAGHDIH